VKLVAAVVAFLCWVLTPLGAPQPTEAERVHCNLATLSQAERARDAELVKVLRDVLRERTELPDGYGYRFEPTALKDVGEWLSIVAKCCQPLSYEMTFGPQPGGPLWVRISGKEGAKEFIELEFAPLAERLAPRGVTR